MPSKVRTEFVNAIFDELPHGPSNTPEKGGSEEKIDESGTVDAYAGRRRSLTDPSVVRDFAILKGRELANVRPVTV